MMLHQQRHLIGGIEAGGTKILCALATEQGELVDQIRIDTGADPAPVVAQILDFFSSAVNAFPALAAIGIGSFGPLSLNPEHNNYGAITATAKPGWQGFNWLSALDPLRSIPIVLDSDVNSAALAEHLYGAGRDVQNLCYVTVGTGIGVGAIVNGKVFGGPSHMEAGHMLVRRVAADDSFAGICPFHGDCLEGLASGPAIAARLGVSAEALRFDHASWHLEADYLAQLCVNLTYTLRPQKIIIGGGVMANLGLFDLIRMRFSALLGGYDTAAMLHSPLDYIVRPQAGEHPGLTGALALAHHQATGAWPTKGYALAA